MSIARMRETPRLVILVDMQRDFVAADGALPVADTEAIVAQCRQATLAAGLDRLHFHDPRGTTCPVLAEAGATPSDIAAMPGWTVSTVNSMLDTDPSDDRRAERFYGRQTNRDGAQIAECRASRRGRRRANPQKSLAGAAGFELPFIRLEGWRYFLSAVAETNKFTDEFFLALLAGCSGATRSALDAVPIQVIAPVV